MSTTSDPYLRLFNETTQASGDQHALRNLRRRIRRDRRLTDTERADLLEQARYVPGCIPGPVELYPPAA